TAGFKVFIKRPIVRIVTAHDTDAYCGKTSMCCRLWRRPYAATSEPSAGVCKSMKTRRRP
ncbi:hypothetical protein, partial [Caballeronia choica]|uniref:hypothetical protein n=1 Tax=Caballeronia choica TaxID=326476 RepID=UPI001F299D11